MTSVEYAKPVDEYLESIGVKVVITKNAKQNCPNWGECKEYHLNRYGTSKIPHNHGFEYDIFLERGKKHECLGSFWASINDCYKTRNALAYEILIITNHNFLPSAYGVLSAFMNDVHTNRMTFQDWASDLGYDTDSRKAEQTYRACLEISIKLQRFFSAEEIEKLQELAQ